MCRHQDRPAVGNAIGRAEHNEDMALICEMGANTLRLAHHVNMNELCHALDPTRLTTLARFAMSGVNELVANCEGATDSATVRHVDKKTAHI